MKDRRRGQRPSLAARAGLLSWLVAASVVGAGGPLSVRGAEKPARVVPADAREQILSWFIIGWSSPDAAQRHVGWGLPRIGWDKFVETHVRPQLRWGIRRVMLHNPFGALAGEEMQFSQFVQAKKQGHIVLTDRDAFVRAWKPVTGQGIEVIAYLGSPTQFDHEYGPLIKQGDEVARRRLEDACLEPVLAAGMSVALDAASGQDERSPAFELAKRLRGEGVRVYIEALPSVAAKHWHDYPAVCTEWFWENPDRPNWEVTETSAGTTVLLTEGGQPTTWADWEKHFVRFREHIAGGRSVAIGSFGLEKLTRSRTPIERLLPEGKAVK